MRCNLDRSLINIYLHGNSFSKENLNRYKIIKEVLFENYRIEQSVFRIKDKLLPIDDYIKKIMSSEAYINREC